MNKHISDDIVEGIHALYMEDDVAQRFFDRAAKRTNDAARTSIDRMTVMAQASRPETIRLARNLHELGCGQFVQGRKGWKSRMVWSYSLRSLGAAAQDITRELEDLDPELEEDAEDQEQIAGAAFTPELEESRLTIAEAKRQLAESLGIEPEAIEITIRA